MCYNYFTSFNQFYAFSLKISVTFYFALFAYIAYVAEVNNPDSYRDANVALK